MCNKTAEYDYDGRANKFEDLAKNYALISIVEKLKNLCCTKWSDKLSSPLLAKIDTLIPYIDKV